MVFDNLILHAILDEQPVKMFKNFIRLLSTFNKTSVTQSRLLVCHTTNKNVAVQPLIISYRLYCAPASETTKSPGVISSFISKEQQNKKPQTEEDELEKQRESAWRTMKYTLIAFGVSFGCLGSYLIYELGKAPTDPNGNLIMDEYSHYPLYKQYFYRTLRELDYYKRMIKEPSREKLLPDPVQPPYYQPPYTLVMEMTDVLVHPDYTYQTGWRFKKRPGIDHFLENLSGVFEIVIFTAEQGMTVFPIIEALDPNNIISYKLVRDATHYVDGHHVKDLSKLNRDLSKVIVIDWNSESVKFHPDNLFHLQRWSGNDEDSTLMDLTAFLRTIAQSEIDDVREVLRYYNQFEDPLNTFREKQKQLMEQQEADRQAKDAKSLPVVKRWAPGLLNKKPL